MLSKVVKEVRSWLGTESPIVIARVLGTSPDSSSLQVSRESIADNKNW